MAESENYSVQWTPESDSDPLVQEFFKAIEEENADKVRSMLKQHPELVDKKGIVRDGCGKTTPLMEACFVGMHGEYMGT